MEQLLFDAHETYVLTIANTVVRLACIGVLTGCVFVVATHRWFFLNWIIAHSTIMLAFNAEFVLKHNNLYGIVPETGSFLLLGLSLALASNGIRLFFSEERSIRSLVILGLFPATSFLVSGLITRDQNVMSAFGFVAAAIAMLDPAFNFYCVGFKKKRYYGCLLVAVIQVVYSMLLAPAGIAMAFHLLSVTVAEDIAPFILIDLAGAVLIFTSLIIIVMEQAQQQLRASVLQDPLTGLANRRRVYQFIDNPQLSPEASTNIMLIDIDHFKSINDTYGHSVGDSILISFADRLRSMKLRHGDVVARWGGEEFIVILNNYSPPEATHFANHCLQKLADVPYNIDGRALRVTASIGLAERRSPNEDLSAVIDRADKALYVAKAAGRNRLEVFDSRTEVPDALADFLVADLNVARSLDQQPAIKKAS